MARAQTVINRFDMSGGFLTEFTELTFPENVTVDESNFTIEYDGSRKRRLGLDYETAYSLHDTTAHLWSDGYATAVFPWRNVGGLSDTNFIVVQVGQYLHFYENESAFSDNKVTDTVDLTTFKVSSATTNNVRTSRIDGAYGRARFFVVGEYLEPFYVSWDGTNISTTLVTIIERDFEGADSGLEISTRPSSLSDEHNYNLRNQGWPASRINEFEDGAGNYPSNADVWHFGLFADTSTDGRRSFDWRQLRDQDFGNTPAPKGRFLRNIFDTRKSFNTDDSNEIFDLDHTGLEAGFSTTVAHSFSTGDTIVLDDTSFTYLDNDGVSQTYTYANESFVITNVDGSGNITVSHDIANFDTADPDASFTSLDVNGSVYGTFTNPSGEVVNARPTSVAFFAGRVWWSGIADDRLANKVYFSKVLEFEDQIGECYQEADPTSEHISELIETDGGVLTLAEMGQVRKMGVVGKSIVLFADNGVWNIGPGEGGYFTATSFSIRKVSDVGIASPQSVLFAEGIPIVWAYQGIYVFSEDQVSGFLAPQSMSFQTIQSFYRDIPDASKEAAFGAYDDIAKVFYWAWSSDEANPSKYDSVLLYDARRKAYMKYDIGKISNGPFVAGIAERLGYDDTTNKLKFLTIEEATGKFTFSNLKNTDFLDWEEYDSTGVDAPGFLLTSYEAGQDVARDKQTPTITFVFKKTETGTNASGELLNPGSCFMQARWDWSNSENSNKWNPERQIYKLRRTYHTGSHPSSTYEDGHPVVWSRNKVRGRGRALNFKLRTEVAHDCHILGWQITMTGNTET